MANIFSIRTEWPSVLPCHLELHTMSSVSDVAGCEEPLSLSSSLSVSLNSSIYYRHYGHPRHQIVKSRKMRVEGASEVSIVGCP